MRSGFTYAHIVTHPARPPQLQLLDVAPKGHTRKTKTYIDIPDTPIMQALQWGRAVIGPAEFAYPHPKGWTINSLDKPYDLTQLTVKRLTAIFRSRLEVSPTCTTSWPAHLKTQRLIPWDSLGPLIHSPLTTTKDIHSWFKCILHRGMAVRRVFPKDGNEFCRLCDCAVERIEHLANCSQLRTTFAPFIKLMRDIGITGSFDDATLLLGCLPTQHDDHTYSPLPNGLFSLLLVLWKFIILMLTEVDTANARFSADRVWRLTLTRIVERCNALHFTHQLRVRRAKARDSTLPNPAKLTKALAPLARVDAEGEFHYSQQFLNLTKHHLGENLRIDQAPQSADNPAAKPSIIAFVKAST